MRRTDLVRLLRLVAKLDGSFDGGTGSESFFNLFETSSACQKPFSFGKALISMRPPIEKNGRFGNRNPYERL